jgi:hypothetical protein
MTDQGFEGMDYWTPPATDERVDMQQDDLALVEEYLSDPRLHFVARAIHNAKLHGANSPRRTRDDDLDTIGRAKAILGTLLPEAYPTSAAAVQRISEMSLTEPAREVIVADPAGNLPALQAIMGDAAADLRRRVPPPSMEQHPGAYMVSTGIHALADALEQAAKPSSPASPPDDDMADDDMAEPGWTEIRPNDLENPETH